MSLSYLINKITNKQRKEIHMKSEIICIGTELLLGNTVNTNAAFLSEELAKLGINVYYHTVVGDNPDRLAGVISNALERSDLIITTGGLGPTSDDITKEVITKALNKELVLNKEELERLKSFFKQINREMTANNIKQAYIPENSIPVRNHIGTAPGIIIESDKNTVIMLPGPPSEMKTMYTREIMPYLKSKSEGSIISTTIKFFGIGESSLEEALIDLIENQSDPTIAPYAGEGEVKIRITTRTPDGLPGDALKNTVKVIEDRLDKYIYSYNEETLEEVTAKYLMESNLTLAVAESCTGGRISSMLTSVPGISKSLLGTVVSYNNDVKAKLLGVKEETLKNHGAVSRETAIEMAAGARKACNADLGLSVTGIAGPSGGTPQKPVGLVYIALSTDDGIFCWERRFSGNREKIQNYSAKNALNYLRLYLAQKKKAADVDNFSF